MAIYLKWHMCPYHEPLVAQITICSNTFGRGEYIPNCLSNQKVGFNTIVHFKLVAQNAKSILRSQMLFITCLASNSYVVLL